MANELVGQSVAKTPEPTKVPKSAPAPKEAIDAVTGGPAPEGFESAPADMAPSAPQVMPNIAESPTKNRPAFEDLISSGDFQDADEDLKVLPAYANGMTPETPINKSPLDVVDRLKLAAGNKVGKLQYLKTKFGDATIDKKGNFLVNQDGSWFRVDADGLGDGDAWDRTKELLADMTDLSDIALSTAGSLAGAAGGAAVGGVAGLGVGAGPGSVAGAALGGAAAEGLRSSLGRLVGTYDATPEEQIKDIGWEGLLAMGGQTVALGAKPVLGMMKSALSNISTSATNVAKEMSSGVWAQLTGQPRWALRRAMDAPADVIDKAQDALKLIPRGASPVDAIDKIAGKQNVILEGMASEADGALKGQYKKDLGELVARTPETFSADVKTMVNEAKIALHDAGYGKIVGKPGSEKFIPLTTEEIAAKMAVPEEQLPKILGPDTRKALNEVASILNDYGKFGTLSGKTGAAKTVELKRALNESFDHLLGENVPASIRQIVISTKKNIEQNIGKSFTQAGVGEKFVAMNNNYATYKDAVDLLTKAVRSKNPTDIDNLVKKLVSKSGSFKSLKDEAKSLANLLPDGAKRMESLVDWEAAKSFLDFVPKTFGGNSATTLGKIAGAVTQQSNPRAVAQQIKYGSQTVDFLKSMGPKQLSALMSNDQAIQSFFQIPLEAASRENKQAQEMLKQSGIQQ
jgi:hypothetical protein